MFDVFFFYEILCRLATLAEPQTEETAIRAKWGEIATAGVEKSRNPDQPKIDGRLQSLQWKLLLQLIIENCHFFSYRGSDFHSILWFLSFWDLISKPVLSVFVFVYFWDIFSAKLSLDRLEESLKIVVISSRLKLVIAARKIIIVVVGRRRILVFDGGRRWSQLRLCGKRLSSFSDTGQQRIAKQLRFYLLSQSV